MNVTRANPPVVVLFGFMGSGKSTAGAALAGTLNLRLIDCDAEIERIAGKTIRDIFDEDGESRFRGLEREFVTSLDVSGGAVVATGGGMVADEFCRNHLVRLGLPVLLDGDVDQLIERTAGDPHRPMAGTRPGRRERLAALYEERRAASSTIAIRLDTTCRSREETVHDLTEIVRSWGRCIPVRVDTRPLPGVDTTPANTRHCAVFWGEGATEQAAAHIRALGTFRRAVVMAPATVDQHTVGRAIPALADAGFDCEIIPIDDGDENKSLDQAARIVEQFSRVAVTRDTLAVTMGGGVTGDLGGFVAATYMRGIPWVNIPTTLLAQVDAGVGGKVGVNTARAKNLVGTFYHPHIVACDPAVLATLPPRELANGYAEVVKTAMIGNQRLFTTLRDAAESGASPGDPALLEGIVGSCVRTKLRIVEVDPYERDLRRVLNLGHTLGHAIESVAGYRVVAHGEAVALGLLAALRMSHARGKASAEYIDATENILRWAGLPVVSPPGLDPESLARAMTLDKKHRKGRLTFVLPVSPGTVRIVDDVTPEEIISHRFSDNTP